MLSGPVRDPPPILLLWPLSRNILWIFSSRLPGNFALKNGGDFSWFFSGLRLPQSEARKLLKTFGENSEQNSGQNSGRKIEKFGKLSFSNFSDLIYCAILFKIVSQRGVSHAFCLCFMWHRASIAEMPLLWGGGGVAPPLRILSKGEGLRERGEGVLHRIGHVETPQTP